jgi:acyl-CoA synthetase (NDP forming)
MSNAAQQSLYYLFHPSSIALAGITVANPDHWTRVFVDALTAFEFDRPLYLVNPRGGEIKGRKVYTSMADIPDSVEYVISTVSAQAAPGLIMECAEKGVKAVHFCTSGFSETGEEEGIRLQNKLVELSRQTGIRIIGPNCMGVYCPESRVSFNPEFPRESGSVAYISQSGGNAAILVRDAGLRGVRFSKVMSYGNACDLNESDFLEYLTTDPDTKIIAMYIEGVRDGVRFRKALEKAVREKTLVLLKGGATEGGARATASHTGALSGSQNTWDALCKQLNIIQVDTLPELADMLVTLQLMALPRGNGVALIGMGGGPSVLITDQFERCGLRVPSLPEEIRKQIREYSQAAGNMLRNPVDYGQNIWEAGKFGRTIDILYKWEDIDLVTVYLGAGVFSPTMRKMVTQIIREVFEATKGESKPTAVVFAPAIVPAEAAETFPIIEEFVSLKLPVYYSFPGAAKAISLVLNHSQPRIARLKV